MHQGLEFRAMIGLNEMGQLMDNHIILHPLGKMSQIAADPNGPGQAIAGAPPALLVRGIQNAVPAEASLEVPLI